MFTGIIDHVGEVQALEGQGAGARAWIGCRFAELKAGESIAVDGVCLTVTEPRGDAFAVDLSPETMRLTTARGYRRGTRVNLERALCLGDRLGGHIVTGHVDHTARLAKRSMLGNYVRLEVRDLPASSRPFLFVKGSVTLQGTSLTVNEILPDGFAVLLVPHTLGRTTLGALAEGDLVNIECDWLAKLFLNAQTQALPFRNAPAEPDRKTV